MSLVGFFYAKILITIVVAKTTTAVRVEMNSGKKKHTVQSMVFETTGFDKKMQNFIEDFTRESPNVFVAVLDNSFEQGAIGSCNASVIRSEMSDAEFVCHKALWSVYTSKKNIQSIKKRYEHIGVDYIFSPFSLLTTLFQDKITTESALFVLLQEASLSVMVFGASKLLYAKHIDIQDSKNDTLLIDTITIDDEIMLNIEDDEPQGGLDSFGDIEDLELGGSIDEFSQVKSAAKEPVHAERALVHSGANYQRFMVVQNAVDLFYKSSAHESIFLESAYVADSAGDAADFETYLEEEMFLSVFMRKIELLDALSDLAKAEW